MQVDRDGRLSTFVSGFVDPIGLAFDQNNNLYVADCGGKSVLKVTKAGVVSTFATGFGSPTFLTSDSTGNLYVTDRTVGVIWLVTPAGVVSKFASELNTPTGLAFDNKGQLSINGDNTVVRVVGVVTPFASGFDSPWGLTFRNETFYVINAGVPSQINSVSQVTPDGVVSTFASGFYEEFLAGGDLAFDDKGNLYVTNSADYTGYSVSVVRSDSLVRTSFGMVSNSTLWYDWIYCCNCMKQ